MNIGALIPVSIALYLAAAAVIGLRLFGGPDRAESTPRIAGIGLGLAALASHGLLLYQGIFVDGSLNLGFFHAASAVTWLIVLVLMISSLSKPVENLGIALLPLAAITVLLTGLYPEMRLLPDNLDFGLKLHVLVSLLAYSLLTLGAVQAILLAIQDRHLRIRHPGGFIRSLPPLQTMESLLFEMIAVGFALLTAALLSGFMFLQDMFAQHLVHKTLLSLISWVVFAVLLWGRYRFGWRGRIAIRWTLSGFVVLMLAYFGSKAVLELMLNR